MSFVPRTWQTIQAQIIAQVNSLIPQLTSTSKAAYWRLWTFIQAVSQNLMEQRFQLLQDEIESTVASAIPGTAAWIQKQVLLFQDGNTVQINEDLTFGYPEPSYPTPITSCAVVVNSSGAVNIKVAQGDIGSQTPLSSGQVIELKSYLAAILPAGLTPGVISVAADTLQVNAVVYYNGQYNSVIQTNVINAINEYMSLTPFNGLIKVSDIEKTILGVTGVVDVTFSQITCASVAGGVTSNLISGSTLNARYYQTYAGYLVNASAPNDFASTISFAIAQQ